MMDGKPFARTLGFGAALALLGLVPTVAEAQWPQWEGPHRNGTAEGTIPAAPQLKEAWRTPLDAGVGSVVVSEGTAYVLASDLDNDLLVALNAADGKEKWRAVLDATPEDSDNGPGSTPAVAGGTVFALSTSCQLVAVQGDGTVLWRRDLVADYQAAHRGGCSTDPMPHGDTVVVHVNGREKGRVVAFHQKDGTTAWEATAEPAMGSSPVTTKVGDAEQLVVQTLNLPQQRGQRPTSKIYGLDLTNHTVAWSFSTDASFSFASPLVVGDGAILLSTWTDSHLLKVRPGDGGDTVEKVWSNRDIKANIGLPVYHEGFVYGVGNEELACIDTATGKTRWRERTYPGSVILVDGHLVLLSQHAGLLRLVAASPEGYREEAKLQLADPGYPMEAAPSYAEGKIYVRTLDAVIAVAVSG